MHYRKTSLSNLPARSTSFPIVDVLDPALAPAQIAGKVTGRKG
jgi:hypothetical protein